MRGPKKSYVAAPVLLLLPVFLAFGTDKPESILTIQENLQGTVALSLHDFPEDGEKQVLVRMDVAGKEHPLDGIPDRIFRFQTERAPEELPLGLLENVVLSHSTGVIEVSWMDSSAPFLSLVVAGFGDGVGETSVEGFGLSTVCGADYGFWALGDGTLTPEQLERLSLDCSEEPPECTAGGPGSQNCSIEGCEGSPTGCSTTCKIGKYSCCWCVDEYQNEGACCKCFDGAE